MRECCCRMDCQPAQTRRVYVSVLCAPSRVRQAIVTPTLVTPLDLFSWSLISIFFSSFPQFGHVSAFSYNILHFIITSVLQSLDATSASLFTEIRASKRIIPSRYEPRPLKCISTGRRNNVPLSSSSSTTRWKVRSCISNEVFFLQLENAPFIPFNLDVTG